MSELQKFFSCEGTWIRADNNDLVLVTEGEWVKASDAEAALAAKDARIKELEALVERLKDENASCFNCKHCDLDVKEYPCNMCDETDVR